MTSVLQVENLSMVAAGSGVLREPISREAIELTGADKPSVLLIGTPKTRLETFGDFVVKATEHFEGLGVSVVNLHNFDEAPTETEATHKIGSADMIWVAGGDTLRMMDFWREHGIDSKIGEVATRGTVLSGGSAGMLAWFEQGHSDSYSYRVAEGEAWDYIFVRGLGYIAAAGCPHYDSRTKQATLRERDFKSKFVGNENLSRVGIGITNKAALAIHHGQYKVIQVYEPAKRSSVHILRKIDYGLRENQLPISNNYRPFEPEVSLR